MVSYLFLIPLSIRLDSYQTLYNPNVEKGIPRIY